MVESTPKRLVAERAVSIDGIAGHIVQLIDTKEQRPCAIAYGNPGDRVACLPRATGVVVYLDDKCSTAPYLQTSITGETWIQAQGVGPKSGAVRIGARVESAQGQRYIGTSAESCFIYGLPSNEPLYAIAEFVPLDQLAQGTLEQEDVSEQLSAIVFNGDDGSRFIYDLVDPALHASCRPAITENGARCATDVGTALHDGLFDTTCERIAVREYSNPVLADIAGLGVYRFESAVDQEHVARLNTNTCAIEALPISKLSLFIGTPYPVSAWPAIGFDAVGNDRLKARVAVLPSGEKADVLRWLDDTRLFEDNGEPCGPVWVGDTLRCLPASPAGVYDWELLFSDAECTQRAIATEFDATPPTRITMRDGVAGAERGNLATGRVFEVGEELVARGGVYQYDFDGRSCMLACRSGVYALGAEVPAESYPELHLTGAQP